MTWHVEQVADAIGVEPRRPDRQNALTLPVFVEDQGIGVGVDGSGAAVLVLPSQESSIGFETKALKFAPWCDAEWLEQGRRLPKCAVLRCNFERDDAFVKNLVASIFVGLIDLQQRFGEAGRAILRLKALFGEGFGAGPDVAKIRGLLGELVVIEAAQDPVRAVEAWHIDTDSRYDFSVDSVRVEVKATTASVRQHHFTSRQLPPSPGVDVHIASVLLAEVSIGSSVADFCRGLEAALPAKLRRKVADIVVETVGLPPAAITYPKIDHAAATASIRTFAADEVPTPISVQGVVDLRWSALLRDDAGVQGVTHLPLFNGRESVNG